MARPRTQLNRRTDILDAAQELFTEKSFEKTTIEEISKHIGIGKGSVYLDFKNKEEILEAIIERYARFSLENVEFKIKKAKPPYLELLKEILENHPLNVFDMVTSQVHTYIALLHTSYQIKQKLNYIVQRWLDDLAFMLENAAKNGEIKPFNDYKSLAHIITVTLQGFLPPYDLKYSTEYRTDLTKEQIRSLLANDVSIAVEIILSGLEKIK